MRHIISVDTILSVLGALFLCIPFMDSIQVGRFDPNDPFFIYWFGGFFVLGFFVALLSRNVLAALLKGGVLPAVINSIILGGWMFYTLVFNSNMGDQLFAGDGMFVLVLELALVFGACFISAICGIVGSLPGLLLGKRFRSSGKRPETYASTQDYKYPTYRQY